MRYRIINIIKNVIIKMSIIKTNYIKKIDINKKFCKIITNKSA